MKENNIIGIYCIKNMKNNKVYVGQSRNIIKRRTDHLRDLKKGCHDNSYLQRAWLKSNKGDFKFFILEQDLSVENLNIREGYWISKFNSCNGDFGYNLQEVDLNGNYSLNETRKLELSRYGYFRHHPNATEEDFNRYIYLKANPIPKINLEPGEVQRRPIIQIDKTTGLFVREFRSLAEASKEMGCPNYKKIQDSARGDIKSYRGYVYVYKDQYDETKDYIVRRPTKYKNSKSI